MPDMIGGYGETEISLTGVPCYCFLALLGGGGRRGTMPLLDELKRELPLLLAALFFRPGILIVNV